MFDVYFLEFDLDIAKADHLFETASDKLDITAMELYTLESAGMLSGSEDPDEMFAEAAGKFVDAIKAFFQKIKDAIKKLYLSIKDAIENAIRKHNINKKMKEIREMVNSSKEIQKALGTSNSEITDTAGLYKAYSEYMKEMLKQTRQVYSKTYDSVDEYNVAIQKANDILSNKADSLNMTVSEKAMVSMKFGEAFKFTEKESNNIAKVTEMYIRQWITSMDEVEKVALAQDDASKVSDLKGMVSKQNSVMSQGLNKIKNGWSSNYKAVLAAVGAAVAATGTAVGVATVRARSKAKEFDQRLKDFEQSR